MAFVEEVEGLEDLAVVVLDVVGRTLSILVGLALMLDSAHNKACQQVLFLQCFEQRDPPGYPAKYP